MATTQQKAKSILKSKTVITGALAIAGAIVAGQTGDLTTADAWQTAIIGLLGIFQRMAIQKSANGTL